MKLKLTRGQFRALYQVFGVICLNQPVPDRMEAKLLKELINCIYGKFYKQGFNNKMQYTISLTNAEAIAFWVFFQKYEWTTDQIYEANLVDTLSNQIHQKHTV